MLVQPDTPSTGIRPVFPLARPGSRPLPIRAAIGLLLAGIGFLLERLPSLLDLYLLRSMTIVAYVQLVALLSAVGFLLLGCGLFLALWGIRQRLPAARPWISGGAVAALAGGGVTAVIGLVYLLLAPSLFSFASPNGPAALVGEILIDGIWLAETVLGAGVLVALLGIVYGLRSSPAAATAPPSS